MADNTTTTWASALYDMRAAAQEFFATDHPYLAELSGVGDPSKVGRFTRDMDTNRQVFSGAKVRQPVIPYGMQSGGWVSQTGTWNVPSEIEIDEVHINLCRFVQPFTITVDLERDSVNNSALVAVATLIKMARQAVARNENIAFLGDGTGLLAAVTGGTTGTLVVEVGTSANFDVLLPGMIVDVLTRSTGADAGQGKRRKIASVDESAGTITFDTNATASDGGSGNITFSTSSGIYLPGSYGNAPQGLQEALAQTGDFEGVTSRDTKPWWLAIDGRDGDTTTLPLSDSMMRGAARRGRRYGTGVWDFGIGDPAAIDLFIASKESQVRYTPQMGTLKSGFSGIQADIGDRPVTLVKEPAFQKGSLALIVKDSIQLYGDGKGPDFLDDDGSTQRRFSRTLAKEMDMLDRVQQGFLRVNNLVFLNDLDVEE